jgi:hypothetical protein
MQPRYCEKSLGRQLLALSQNAEDVRVPVKAHRRIRGNVQGD